MKQIILVFSILFVFSACRTARPVVTETPVQDEAPRELPLSPAENAAGEINYHDQTTWLLGFFNPGQLKREPHSAWFIKGYDEYIPSSQYLNILLDIPHDALSVKIVMGSWCSDSRREVPKFMKILDLWQFPPDKVTFIGVDEAKIAPVGEYEKLNIERVPTFIIMKNNVEAGRIIETPVTSLEQDMVNILTGMNNK